MTCEKCGGKNFMTVKAGTLCKACYHIQGEPIEEKEE